MEKAEATHFITELARYGSQRRAAAALGLAQSTISFRYNKAREVLGAATVDLLMQAESRLAPEVLPEPAPEPQAAKPLRGAVAEVVADALKSGDKALIDLKLLEEENNRLRAQNRTLAEQVLTDEKVSRQIFEIAHSKPTAPAWLSRPVESRKDDSLPGVPILFGSDWHWGEVVQAAEIGGVNEYNLEIARARLARLVDTTIDLLTNHMVNPQYPGIVFALGGDIVSGDIHEELSITNDKPMMPVVLDVVNHLYAAIKRLKEVFGKVFLPCVSGNHGRNTRKVHAKEFNYNSFDWLIYKQLERLYADDEDVVFYISEGTDALVSVNGHKYCFTHGNQFRGGDGLIGPLGPVVRGDHKKRGRNSQVGQEYDTLVIGHFHQLLQTKRIIMNGSLIGYNEYAYSNNFGYEPPQQALWITHPDHGITFSMPVNVGPDFGKKDRESSQPWVAFHEVKKAA